MSIHDKRTNPCRFCGAKLASIRVSEHRGKKWVHVACGGEFHLSMFANWGCNATGPAVRVDITDDQVIPSDVQKEVIRLWNAEPPARPRRGNNRWLRTKRR